MGTHQHEPVELPGGQSNPGGRAVNQRLLGELTAAAMKDCTGCVDRLVAEAAVDPVCVARLVEVSRLVALRVYRGELPPFMTDDHDMSGPSTAEFRRLVRAVNAAEPLFEECEQMTVAERLTAARTALELLVGYLSIAEQEGVDTAQTLSQACVAVSSMMISWWRQVTPMADLELSQRWKERAFAHRDMGLPRGGQDAVALLLGGVLHHQALRDDVTIETLGDLVFTRVVPVLRDPVQTSSILSAYTAPPEIDDITVPVKRLARGDTDFLTELCLFARYVVTAHAVNCPHGLRESDHECTLAHRAAAINGDTRPQVAAAAPDEGRRVALPVTRGYREDDPVEGAPAGYPEDHVWQINVARILLERWDADVARWNENISEDSSISEPNYDHEVGLEALACPACGSREHFLVEGRWGDPLTLHCRCGVTVMSPVDPGPGSDLGRRLLHRLILCEADPAYAARRLMPPVAEYRDQGERHRTSVYYRGPDDEDIALVSAIDLDTDNFAWALMTALRPKLPERHGGRALTLLLLQVAYALANPIVRDSEDGHRLEDQVRTLVADLKRESDRWAPARQPVLERLQSWQDASGPEAWQAAWARMLEVAGGRFTRYRVGDGSLSDGCAALALALYILSGETGASPDEVHVDEVRDLLPGTTTDGDTQAAGEIPRQWGARLQALGHDPDAENDPVTALLRHLTTERPVGILGDRRASALAVGLDSVLGPIYNIRF
ncbi:hypothetical protein GCM10010430_44460 [Kitasatospora cystarginea]|uniref:Uncharacterized protein n=1 Tax=Kitasatospora cystarginea TaxID=58350 RepID=A0ABP5RAB0_9ACTN